MPRISALSPLDQPFGNRRLLDDLKRCLSDEGLTEFGFVVAFAKVGPLYRLQDLLEKWHVKGGTSSAIFGIDHCGTSVQALQFAQEKLGHVFYTQYRGYSFHPKIYWFKGPEKAIAFIGSNNMTVGGTELNFEAAIELEFDLPREQDEFEKIYQMYTSLLPDKCQATRQLTADAIVLLEREGLLLDEADRASRGASQKRGVAHPPGEGFRLPVKPASALPPNLVFGKAPKKKELEKKAEALKVQADVVDVSKPFVPVSGFAIQIKPHHNGEIFLSKTAAQQNPAFFGMPFTGESRPKKGQNSGYPQRYPDPVCNIVVFGKKNDILYSVEKYSLNTVFYDKKSEIRVTASPLVAHVPEYSVLVMTLSDETDVDYEMQIFTPQSPGYKAWEDICNQKMPSGGKVPRKYGWF